MNHFAITALAVLAIAGASCSSDDDAGSGTLPATTETGNAAESEAYAQMMAAWTLTPPADQDDVCALSVVGRRQFLGSMLNAMDADVPPADVDDFLTIVCDD